MGARQHRSLYSATKLKCTMKKFDFFPREIETTTPILCDQAWSRASKKVGVVVSIASNCEKSAAQGAKKGPFCMGILVTLRLSTEFAPTRAEIFCC